MKKFILAFFLIMSTGALSLNAQINSPPPASISEQTIVSADNQSEYLVVSVTKFQLDLGEKEESPQRKWLGRRTGSVGFYQEADVQREFDRLGKLGWELTGVLPGSDSSGNFFYGGPKFIFKRRFDSERSQREAEMVSIDEKERTQSLKKAAEIIDLDSVESNAQREEVERRAETRLRQTIQNIKEIPVTISKLQIRLQPDSEPITQAEIIVDGSKVLLKESNKYRSSEARNYLRKVATGIFDTIGLKQTDSNREPFVPNYVSFDNVSKVQIIVSVVVNSNGVTRTVAQGMISGNWAEVASRSVGRSQKTVLNLVTFNP